MPKRAKSASAPATRRSAQERVAAVILAAGKGTRMRSELAKALFPLCGKPMIWYTMEAAKSAGLSRRVVIVGHEAEQVKEAAGCDCEFVTQMPQRGTGHALMSCEAALKRFRGTILVLYCDTPLIDAATIRNLLAHHLRTRAAATVLSVILDDPGNYGRIIRRPDHQVMAIVEAVDASAEQRKVHEVNAGLVAFEAPLIFEMLHRIRPHNLQEEYYLTDAIEELIAAGHRVEALVAESPLTTMGVNTRADLATVESVLRQRVRERLMVSGVTLIDPPSTFVDSGVEVGQDTVIYPFCVIEGKTVIGSQSQVGPGCRLVDAHIGDRVQISNSVVVEGVVPSGARLGPFAYLRDGRDTAAEAEPCAPSPPAASKKRAAKRR